MCTEVLVTDLRTNLSLSMFALSFHKKVQKFTVLISHDASFLPVQFFTQPQSCARTCQDY